MKIGEVYHIETNILIGKTKNNQTFLNGDFKLLDIVGNYLEFSDVLSHIHFVIGKDSILSCDLLKV